MRIIILSFLLFTSLCFAKAIGGHIYCENVENNGCKVYKLHTNEPIILSFKEYIDRLIPKAEITKIKYKYNKKIAIIYYKY